MEIFKLFGSIFTKKKEKEEFKLSPAWDEYSNIIKETQQIINNYLEYAENKREWFDNSFKKQEEMLSEIREKLEAQGVDLDKYRNKTAEELLADIRKDLERFKEK